MTNTMRNMIMAVVALVIMLTVGNINEVHAAGDNVNITVSGNTVTVSGNGYGEDITVTVTHGGAISDFFLADNMRWNSYGSEVTIVNFKANGPFSFSFPVEGKGVVNFVADLTNGDGSTSQSSVKHDLGGVVEETKPSNPTYADSVKPEPKPVETKPVETKPVEKVETKPVEKVETKPVETKPTETEKKPAPQPVYTLPEVDEEAVKKVYGDNSEKSSESTVKSESNPTTKEKSKPTTRKETNQSTTTKKAAVENDNTTNVKSTTATTRKETNQSTTTKKAAVENDNTTNVKSTTDAKTTSISPVETKKEEKPVELTLPLTGEVTEEATEETSKETEGEIKTEPTEEKAELYDNKVEASFPWWLLVIAFLSGSTIALFAKNKKDEMEAKEEVK